MSRIPFPPVVCAVEGPASMENLINSLVRRVFAHNKTQTTRQGELHATQSSYKQARAHDRMIAAYV